MQVGERPLEAVPDFDPHAPVVARDQQQDAVVLLRLTELPRPEQTVGIGLDRFAAERRDRGDHDLVGRFLLEGRQCLGQGGLGLGIDEIGRVDDAPVSAGRSAACAVMPARTRTAMTSPAAIVSPERAVEATTGQALMRCISPSSAMPHPPCLVPKFTCGTCILSSSTVKFWKGCASVNQNFAQSIDGKVLSDVL